MAIHQWQKHHHSKNAGVGEIIKVKETMIDKGDRYTLQKQMVKLITGLIVAVYSQF